MDVRCAVPSRPLSWALVSAAACTLAALPTVLTAASADAAGMSGDVRLVVGFSAGASSAQMDDAATGAGARVLSDIADLHARVLSVPSSAAAGALQKLRANGRVRFAEADSVSVPTDVTPNDPYFPTGAGALSGGEWGSAKTGMPSAWGVTTGSSTVIIAIVDSGVVTTHPDLAPVLTDGWNVLTGTSDATDTYGHGTEVAGVAAAGSNNGQGVAAYCWQCRLMPVKVYNNASAYNSDIAKGITWAADHGARVINVSMAGTSSSTALNDAASYATAHGALVVAAAGNNGNSTPTYPASSPGVVSVAATDQSDTLNSYSDYGSWVDLAAPGSTPTTLPNGAYGAVGGTSIASPAVAGIAALMFSAKTTATPADVTNALLTTTDPTAGTTAAAHGRVNAKNALAALTGSTTGSGSTPSAPAATSAPTISGQPQSDQTLSAATGSWSGSPTAYAYQWQRCDSAGSSCANLAGATGASYVLGSGDVGSTARVVVTASNSAGSGSASSAPTGVVSAPPATTVTSTYSGSLTKSAASRSYPVSFGTGPVQGRLSFSKCSSLSLALVTSSGTTVSQGSGPSVLSVSTTVSAGSYAWVVSGSCRVAFSLTSTSTG